MPFDFPASPNIGDVSNGYRFNGVGWAGGPIVPTPTEQFFDVSGLTQKDIAVPSWAKAVQIIGSLFTTQNYGILCQVSVDGSTFLSGATQYTYGGSMLASGTVAHSPLTGTQGSGLQMAISGDASMTSMPNMFTAEINLVRPNASPALFTVKSYSKAWDSTASLGYRSGFIHSYVNSATTSALAIKALRVIPGGGAFAAGSTLQVKWLGDSIPAQNGIVPEPPMDNWEYTRVNGIWVQKQRTFDVSGLSSLDIAVPSTAKMIELEGSVYSTAYATMALQVSLDGTTFINGANAYYIQGPFNDSGTSPYYGTQGNSGFTYMFLHFGGDNLLVPTTFVAVMNIFCTTNKLITMQAWGTAFRNTAPLHARTAHILSYMQTPSGPCQVKAIRWWNGAPPGVAAAANSYLTVRWL